MHWGLENTTLEQTKVPGWYDVGISFARVIGGFVDKHFEELERWYQTWGTPSAALLQPVLVEELQCALTQHFVYVIGSAPDVKWSVS